MLLQDMTWMDVERYLAADDRIVVITGACEKHGYVSLLADMPKAWLRWRSPKPRPHRNPCSSRRLFRSP